MTLTNENDNKNKSLRENGLAFFGKISASVSHEINNVFSIIGETAGLMADIIYSVEQGRALDLGKIKTLAENISRQVERGKQIVKRLNKFSHCVDEAVCTFDPKEMLANLVALCQRLAEMKKVKVVFNYPEKSNSLHSNSFIIQNAAFLCLETALSVSEKESSIEVTLTSSSNGIRLDIDAPALSSGDDFDSRRRFLDLLTAEINGNLDLTILSDDRERITLNFPSLEGC